mmetsp:Transcript_17175/g.30854  ORF Transcript_17175/g.30854 Transcript_17175/m.30854 type:complete len:91 (+) Transcript_17175:51-323(+)
MKVKTGRGRRISGKKKYTKIRVLRGCKLLSGTHAWVIQFLLLAKSTNVHCPAEIFAFGSSREIGSTALSITRLARRCKDVPEPKRFIRGC